MSGNEFATSSWDEKVVSGQEGGPRVAHAHATMTYSGIIEGTSHCDYLLFYSGEGYDGGGTTSPGLERIEGSVAVPVEGGGGRRETNTAAPHATVEGGGGRREGSFVIRHEVGFDASGIRGTWTVVPGSGTGGLAGLSGTGTIAGATGEQTVAYTFEYGFDS